jgi:hypothetical protein
MHTCGCACACACTAQQHVHVHVHVHVHGHGHVHVHVSIQSATQHVHLVHSMSACACLLCMLVHVCAVHVMACMCMCMYVHVHVCACHGMCMCMCMLHVHVHVHMCMCMCICACACCMLHVHVHVHRVPTQLRRLLRQGDECTPERDAHLAHPCGGLARGREGHGGGVAESDFEYSFSITWLAFIVALGLNKVAQGIIDASHQLASAVDIPRIAQWRGAVPRSSARAHFASPCEGVHAAGCAAECENPKPNLHCAARAAVQARPARLPEANGVPQCSPTRPIRS